MSLGLHNIHYNGQIDLPKCQAVGRGGERAGRRGDQYYDERRPRVNRDRAPAFPKKESAVSDASNAGTA